jgi:hypothetical protein
VPHAVQITEYGRAVHRPLTALVTMAVTVAVAAPASAAATQAELFQPFAHGRPTVQVHHASGSCFSGSIASPRRDAWRCFVGNAIADPCFSSSSVHGVVVCPDPSVRTGVEIRLTKPLPHRLGNHTRPSLRVRPWQLEISDGRACSALTGTSVALGGVRMNYGCQGGLGLWGAPRRSSQPWTMLAARPGARHLHARQAIVRAWM